MEHIGCTCNVWDDKLPNYLPKEMTQWYIGLAVSDGLTAEINKGTISGGCDII
jgi:hypothetical protein